MEDKEYTESNVISEVVSNHQQPQTFETLYKEVEALREKMSKIFSSENFAQSRKILTTDYENTKGKTEIILCLW